MPTSLFETFLMMCRSTSALSPVVSMQFSPNYLITMTAHIAMVRHPSTGWNLPMEGTDLLDGGTGTSVVSQRSESGQGILGDEEGRDMW